MKQDQDIVAVIVKIDFGKKSGVDRNEYLGEMERGEWKEWNTPRKYIHLDGKGRKLILYDSKQKALTVEVEIQKIEKMKRVKEYPWKNKFVPKTLDIYAQPIPIAEIRTIKGFENQETTRVCLPNMRQNNQSKKWPKVC